MLKEKTTPFEPPYKPFPFDDPSHTEIDGYPAINYLSADEIDQIIGQELSRVDISSYDFLVVNLNGARFHYQEY